MTNGCWIKTDYISSEKWYEVELCDNKMGGTFRCDDGGAVFTVLEDSSHLDGGGWQVYYGETPPENVIIHKSSVTNNEIGNLEWATTILQEPTSNDNALREARVLVNQPLPVNEVQDVTEEVYSFLYPIYEDWYPKLSTSPLWDNDEKLKDFLDKLKSGEYSVIHNTNIN